MEKRIYISPVLAIHHIKLASGLLLSASTVGGETLLGNGGTTSGGSVTTADGRYDNSWDIWGNGDYDED